MTYCRRILRRLASGEARVTEVAEPFRISLNSVSKHIRLLEPFDELTQWMQETREFWTSRLDRLEAALRAEKRKSK